MIALYLLTAHMLGDFVLQSRWQAVGKFGDSMEAIQLRTGHVLAYCLPFIPIAVIYSKGGWPAAAFMAMLAGAHFFADRQRFESTVGDYITWRAMYPLERRREWADHVGDDVNRWASNRHQDAWPPPNPWPFVPLVIDQTIHVATIAVLAGAFLS